MRHLVRVTLLLALATGTAIAQAPGEPASSLLGPFTSRSEAEEFLRTAEVVGDRGTPEGITRPRRLTLDNGRIQHDAIFKSIDQRKKGVTRLEKTTQIDFKDSWKFEVAAYELDKLLSLNMVPVTVERRYKGRRGSLQLWVTGMLDSERSAKKIKVPNPARWNWQMYKVNIFDKLIYNIDRNPTNLLVTPDWQLVMIDHSRSFKSMGKVDKIEGIAFFSRSLMMALEKIDKSLLEEKLGSWLTTQEIVTLAERHKSILDHYTAMYETRGRGITYP